jgi:hypothetical protein
MPQSEPGFVNQVQMYRTPCFRCGAPTTLARIEPAPQSGHDLRSFECTVCTNTDAIEVACQ